MGRRVFLYFQNMSDFLQSLSHKLVCPKIIQSTAEMGVIGTVFYSQVLLGVFFFSCLSVCLIVFYFYPRNAEGSFAFRKTCHAASFKLAE